MQHREGSDIVHFALALHGGSRALSWAQLAPCIILLLMRRVASARFWGHRGRMMSGSTTPSIHNQRLIGMHQHYWAQRYRLSKPTSGKYRRCSVAHPQRTVLECWRTTFFAWAPDTRNRTVALPQQTTTTPHAAGLPHTDRASHLKSANSCVYQN